MSIDFFILDDISNNLLIQRITIFKAKFIYGMLRSKRYKDDTSKMSLTEKIAAEICKSTVNMFALKPLLKAYIRNTAKYNGNGHENVIRSNSNLYFIGCYSRKYYSKAVYLDFHGKRFPLRAGIMKYSLNYTVIV